MGVGGYLHLIFGSVEKLSRHCTICLNVNWVIWMDIYRHNFHVGPLTINPDDWLRERDRKYKNSQAASDTTFESTSRRFQTIYSDNLLNGDAAFLQQFIQLNKQFVQQLRSVNPS